MARRARSTAITAAAGSVVDPVASACVARAASAWVSSSLPICFASAEPNALESVVAGASSGGSVSGAARVRIRHALADITAGEKVVLREMLRTPEAPDLELFTAARATMPSMTLLDVVQARSRLTTRVKEVMDATQNHTG